MSFVIGANNGANFETPESGMHHGVLADIIDLGLVTTTFQGQSKTQPMVRFVWILNVNGKDGKAIQVVQRVNANLHEKSNLYKITKQILNAAPSVPYDFEQLIGQTRQLFINVEVKPDGKKFANIMGIAPSTIGNLAVPADFVRDQTKPVDQQAKNKKKNTYNNAPAQTAAPVQQQATAPAQGAQVKF